jgi:hypothetical protein
VNVYEVHPPARKQDGDAADAEGRLGEFLPPRAVSMRVDLDQLESLPQR